MSKSGSVSSKTGAAGGVRRRCADASHVHLDEIDPERPICRARCWNMVVSLPAPSVVAESERPI